MRVCVCSVHCASTVTVRRVCDTSVECGLCAHCRKITLRRNHLRAHSDSAIVRLTDRCVQAGNKSLTEDVQMMHAHKNHADTFPTHKLVFTGKTVQ